MNEFALRPATHDDVHALTALARDTFRQAYRLIDAADDIEDYVMRAFSPEIFAAALDDHRSTLLLVEQARHPVGYALLRLSEPPDGVTGPAPIELARLYLRDEVIGQGLGATLMAAVHAEARRRQARTLWLGVYDRNKRARAFYRRWGFVDVGTKSFIFGGRSYADPVMSAPVPPACAGGAGPG